MCVLTTHPGRDIIILVRIITFNIIILELVAELGIIMGRFLVDHGNSRIKEHPGIILSGLMMIYRGPLHPSVYSADYLADAGVYE